MKSTSFIFNNETELYELSSSLAKELVKAPLDSIHSFPIVAQQTELKWVGLNVTRPTVRQIEYGMNVSGCNRHTMRNTYGYGLSTLNINDPRKQATKPYCAKMTKFASLIHKILVQNQDKLGLQDADLSTVFIVCSIPIYYSMPGIKLNLYWVFTLILNTVKS